MWYHHEAAHAAWAEQLAANETEQDNVGLRGSSSVVGFFSTRSTTDRV